MHVGALVTVGTGEQRQAGVAFWQGEPQVGALVTVGTGEQRQAGVASWQGEPRVGALIAITTFEPHVLAQAFPVAASTTSTLGGEPARFVRETKIDTTWVRIVTIEG